VTRIAGPTAGQPRSRRADYVGVADDRGTDVRRYTWTGDRDVNRHESARAALELLVERAEALPGRDRAAG
jgi:nicotinamide mononucleotide (NMN) deamidase PncC